MCCTDISIDWSVCRLEVTGLSCSQVHIQKSMTRLATGSALFFEFMHYKERKSMDSCKAYCYIEYDELLGLQPGSCALEVCSTLRQYVPSVSDAWSCCVQPPERLVCIVCRYTGSLQTTPGVSSPSCCQSSPCTCTSSQQSGQPEASGPCSDPVAFVSFCPTATRPNTKPDALPYACLLCPSLTINATGGVHPPCCS